jgi:hypothetical protein
MVLNDLGRGITAALQRFGASDTAEDAAVDALLKEMSTALLQSDVNIKVVVGLRKAIKAKSAQAPKGSDRRRHVHRAVIEELTALLDPERQPFKPVKGKSNVFMMVGYVVGSFFFFFFFFFFFMLPLVSFFFFFASRLCFTALARFFLSLILHPNLRGDGGDIFF